MSFALLRIKRKKGNCVGRERSAFLPVSIFRAFNCRMTDAVYPYIILTQAFLVLDWPSKWLERLTKEPKAESVPIGSRAFHGSHSAPGGLPKDSKYITDIA